jgi:hypothetical protein
VINLDDDDCSSEKESDTVSSSNQQHQFDQSVEQVTSLLSQLPDDKIRVTWRQKSASVQKVNTAVVNTIQGLIEDYLVHKTEYNRLIEADMRDMSGLETTTIRLSLIVYDTSQYKPASLKRGEGDMKQCGMLLSCIRHVDGVDAGFKQYIKKYVLCDNTVYTTLQSFVDTLNQTIEQFGEKERKRQEEIETMEAYIDNIKITLLETIHNIRS